ncbi:hypothetical protein KS639_RS22375, partial [Escherichia coli]
VTAWTVTSEKRHLHRIVYRVKYFNFTTLHDYNHFCDFIEFKHKNIIMNTSQYTGSSW